MLESLLFVKKSNFTKQFIIVSSLLELSIETKSDNGKIQEFGKQLCMHIAAYSIISLI